MKSLVTKPAQTLVSKLGLSRSSRDKSKDHHQQQQRQQRQSSSSSPVVPKSSVGGNGVGGGGRSNNATTQQQHAKTPLLSNATSDSTAASEADTVSIEVTPTIIPLSRSGAPQLKKLGSNTQRQQQHGGGGILHQPHAHNNINNSHIQSNNNNSSNGSITTSRVRFAPTSHKYSSQSSITSNTTSQSSHQVHLMALGGSQSGCGASVASASVVSKDSIFDRVLREENERLNAMGMGERDVEVDPYCLVKGGAGSSSKGVSGGGSKRDGMRGGRRVEI